MAPKERVETVIRGGDIMRSRDHFVHAPKTSLAHDARAATAICKQLREWCSFADR